MILLPAAIAIIVVAVVGASFALAAFFWALRTKQFSVKHLNEGATVIFDSTEPVGEPTDQIFRIPPPEPHERTNN